jgi:hypothetical protein
MIARCGMPKYFFSNSAWYSWYFISTYVEIITYLETVPSKKINIKYW